MYKWNIVKILVLLVIMISADSSFSVVNGAEVRSAIVKIQAVQTKYDYLSPWDKNSPETIQGSGCIIEGDRIITNAHVISDYTYIQVWRYGQTKKYKAKVLAVSHTADLALLTVNDRSFFKDVVPLQIGPLPEIQQTVMTLGFPEGGETLSITKGIVSRVEHQPYTHSSESLLAVQIDAAINPGNSGGPAILDDKVVGIAMQGRQESQNIGYIVPPPVINHFIKDVEDGQYDGYPKDGIMIQSMENPDIRRRYGLPDNQIGVLVIRVVKGFPADGIIYPGDVLLKVDGHPIASDGTIEFRPNERTYSDFYTQQHQVDESLTFDVLRENNKLTLTVNLFIPPYGLFLVPNERYDIQPTYYVYGGLVFMPLTKNYLKLWGDAWQKDAPSELQALMGKYPKNKGEEVVLLSKVFAHEVNSGYHRMEDLIITHIDGSPVNNMKDLVDRVKGAAKSNYIEFRAKDGDRIVLDPKKVSKSQESISETYGIPSNCSIDLEQG